MIKKRFISMLVLLMTAVTGAWAQEQSETIATTANIVEGTHFTISISEDSYADEDGMLADGGITVTSKNGETITKVVITCTCYTDLVNDGTTSVSSGTKEITNGGGTITVTGVNASTFTFTCSDDYPQFGQFVVYYTEASTVAVTGVTLAPTSATLTLGETETVTLIPTVLPAEATDKSVTWSSSNEAVATVTDGIVTAVAAGTATITVTTTDGAKTATCAVTVAAPAASTYTVTLKEGTEDANSWTIAPAEATTTGVAAGTEVKATYGGMKKVKSVKAKKKAPAPAGPTLDLATVTEATTVEDGYTVTGTLGANVKISIADGATVTLDGVTINGANSFDYEWAGITCLGDATIILSGTNTVKGFYQSYPGIYVPENKTVTIQGIGSLTASSSNISGVAGAGIGGGYQLACGNITIMGGSITAMGSSGAAGIGSGTNGYSCGNITITGGTINASANTGAAGIGSGSNGSFCGNITITGGNITATGGSNAAGIGSGGSASCGNITITGGIINATGTNQAAGIGSGYAANNKTASCGTITITNGVTSVTATKGNATVPNSIGVGKTGISNATNTCGTVTIGCTLDASGNPVGGTTGAITESPYTYAPSAAPAGPTAYTLAESTQGMIVGTDGKAYDVADKDNLPSGVTAAGVVVYKNGANGLAIALTDEASMMDWATACGESGAAAHTPTVEGQTWKLPSQEEWTLVKNANSGSSLNSAITNAGGTAIPTVHFDHETGTTTGKYWLSTEGGFAEAARTWGINGYDEIAVDSQDFKTSNNLVRACLAW